MAIVVRLDVMLALRKIRSKELAEAIRRLTRQRWTIMEVCGGQTHTIVKSGLQELLPEEITLLYAEAP